MRFFLDTRRWGYCTARGNLTFNWQLSTLPEDLSEYIVLHEIINLTDLNHQKGFHKPISELQPDYREKEQELKNYLVMKPNFIFKTKRVQI